jgi:hypothetical protein
MTSEPVTLPMFSTVRETWSLNLLPVTTASESCKLLRLKYMINHDCKKLKNYIAEQVLELTQKQTVGQSFDADNVYIPDSQRCH